MDKKVYTGVEIKFVSFDGENVIVASSIVPEDPDLGPDDMPVVPGN